ncbi:MAG: hypothetical protein JO228_01665 [Xanthobacteraceae bacterium]|nr:hypothetical protein [Xanthobacteraceae bacterium]
MRWLRSNAGRGAWLALFALACQFVLTFGHVHPARIAVDAAKVGIGVPSDAASIPTAPKQRAPDGINQDFCALCHNLQLASTLAVPASPAIVLRDPLIRRVHWTPSTAQAASRDQVYFRARGPPQS